MIQIDKLTEKDKGRAVIYRPAQGPANEERGRISSWNDTYLFVRYHAGDTAAATAPEDLRWA